MSGGDDDGSGGSTGSGGGGSTSNGWTAIPLVNDGNTQRVDNDLVSGIMMTAADKGYVVTQGAGESFSDGGAVFTLDGSTVALAFSGKNGGPSLLGTIDFTGLEQTPTGVVAMAYSADVVRADSAGHFAVEKNGNLAGIEPVIGYRETAAGVTLVRDTGVVSTSTQASGPTATFTDVWAPDAAQPIPAELPANECQGGPLGAGAPVMRSSAYIGNGMIAYTAAPSFDPQVCISKDGGTSFYPSILTVADDASENAPSGVLFSSAMNGITYWGSATAKPYIQHTSDGGTTWTNAALPAAVASHGLELDGAFFAPDGQHGWVVGFDHDGNHALGLSTADGGATWAQVIGLGDAKLYSGFALDATHVWIGGDNGTLLTHTGS
ncbi:MAG: hypothetical protein ABI467_16100 [Kofleriaceae bacterium]